MLSFHYRYKDAIIVSPHKFVGGPGTPGKFEVFSNADSLVILYYTLREEMYVIIFIFYI